MIIRVLHEGQYEVEGQALQQVDELDKQLLEAATAGDATRYAQLIDRALETVRTAGRPLAIDDLRPSDLVLPASDSTLEEVQSLFRSEGLIAS